MRQPEEIYGPLFDAVQTSGVFPDSKTFVDCRPRKQPEAIVEAFEKKRTEDGFDLKTFVVNHFDIPDSGGSPDAIPEADSMEQHIHNLWRVLRREPDHESGEGDSLIPLKRPYIVPGGRFREMYYWDSYFTMLGLAADDLPDLVNAMVGNFADLIDACGHIPNGNRNYFISRSQPPFFALMVRLLAEVVNDEGVIEEYLGPMLREYTFWMDKGNGDREFRRFVKLPDGSVLNRYWDDNPSPRPESYKEDVDLARNADRDDEQLYRDLRAACESGWDFSSRWFRDENDLSTIQTTSIIPVDLNVLLYLLEGTIGRAYFLSGNMEMAKSFEQLATSRKFAIQKYCWSSDAGNFCDFNININNTSSHETLACAYPLFGKLATEEQAAQVAERIQDAFLAPGGLRTTLVNSGQQWDSPNGWAPLQWIAFKGLKNYGFDELANTIASRWIANCRRVFGNTGKMMEKYNVEDLGLEAGGGEYPVQDGFGWTNGVVLAMGVENADFL